MKKDQVRTHVLQAVFAAEVSKGHLKWKVSDLARQTRVSRPLIYYHFGKTKKAILTECLTILAEDYYGLGEDRTESLQPGSMKESLLRTRKLFLANPALGVFYARARMQKSEICDQLVAIEKRFQAKLKRTFKNYTNEEVVALHGLFHGLITAPFLSEKGFEAALAMIVLKRD